MVSPEGNLAGFQSLSEAGAHANFSAFTIINQTDMDKATSAPSGIPYVHLNKSTVNVHFYKGGP